MGRIAEATKVRNSYEAVNSIAARRGRKLVHLRQRAVDDAIVRSYAQAIRAGQYDGMAQTIVWCEVPADVAIAAGYAAPAGAESVLILINGLHTLLAIEMVDTTVWLNTRILRCDSVEDLNYHYRCYDKGRPRSLTDSAKAFGAGEEAGIPPKYTRSAADAAFMITARFRTTQGYDKVKKKETNVETKLEMAAEWYPELRQYLDLLSRCDSGLGKRLRTPVYMATMLMALRKEPEYAKLFLRSLITGTGLEEGDPRLILRDWLKDSKSGLGRGTGLTNGEAARKMAAGWNAWRCGRALKNKLQMSKGGIEADFEMIGVTCDGPPLPRKYNKEKALPLIDTAG